VNHVTSRPEVFILWLFGDLVFELSLNHITHVMLMC